MKQDFHELVHNQVKNLPKEPLKYFTVQYELFYKNPSSDGSNIISKIEKFLLDALKAEELILDDNVTKHLGSTWSIGGQDKQNPRVEITILPVKETNEKQTSD